ncbi:MAG: glycosyltransferase [Methylococcaceae bacterium]|nr:MAG: glycosyltransferase [Methylococcaceae bacterium]
MNIEATPLISVIIPAFNYAASLERAVSSVLSQAGGDFDVWIIDDGSTDDTEAVAATLLPRWSRRLHYHRQTNQGPAAARNQGIHMSRGDYLLFLDADDELLPDALAAFRAGIAGHPEAALWLADHVAVESNGKTRQRRQKSLPDKPEARLRAYLLDKTLIACAGAMLFRRAIFDHYRYPEQFRSAEDLPMFAYALANFPCALIDSATVRVYKHPDSLRGNADQAAATSMQLVDEIFDLRRMPPLAMRLKPAYIARRHLSLFRTLQQAGQYQAALAHYRNALRLSPMQALSPRYLGKALRVLLAGLKM